MELARKNGWDRYEVGRGLKQAGDIDGAIAEFSKAIFVLDSEAAFFNARGDCYHQLGDYKSAIQNFSKAYKLAPSKQLGTKLSRLLVSEGILHLEMGLLAEALHCFNESLLSDNQNTQAMLQKAFTLLGMQQHHRAIEELERYCSIDDTNCQVLIILAKIHKHLKNNTSAAACMQRAVSLYPADKEVRSLLDDFKGGASDLYRDATDCLLEGEDTKAVAILSRGIDLDPTDIRFFVRRGVALRRLGQHDKSISDLTHALQITKGNHREARRQLTITYNELGVELHGAGNLMRALTFFGLAIQNEQEVAVLYLNRGDVFRDLGQLDKAMADYTYGHKIDDSNIELRRRLALVMDAQGLTFMDDAQYSSATASFTQAIEVLPGAPLLHLHRGLAAMETGNLTMAHSDLSRVVQLDPDNEVAWARLRLLQASNSTFSAPQASVVPPQVEHEEEEIKLAAVMEEQSVMPAAKVRALVAQRKRLGRSLRQAREKKLDVAKAYRLTRQLS